MSFCLCFYRCSLFAFLGQNPNVIYLFRETKKAQATDYQLLGLSFGRDYWTRTSDLAPPRRVRYQLR